MTGPVTQIECLREVVLGGRLNQEMSFQDIK